jgi:hypothetical protein
MNQEIENICNQIFNSTVYQDLTQREKEYKASLSFLEKYWLSEKEYLNTWLPIKNKIFRVNSICLPDLMFNPGFDLIFLLGGLLFYEEYFNAFKKCIDSTGDTHFVIIQNANEDEVPFHLKFPSKISWLELLDGGAVSFEVFKRPIRDYYVFGDTGSWGKYLSDEYSLDIIGFREEYKNTFMKNVGIYIKEQKEDVLKKLPPSYKHFIN